ncbi:MAG: orotate phosphoribosyltransferase [Phycisphaerales bacterium]|nr:MAG: orotate phosphoribosyltransferase [Phycisphaerales bacterium]
MSRTLTREEVARRIAEVALLRGEFTLRSGRKSSYYLDKYLFSTRPDILAALGELFAERVAALTADVGGVSKLAGAELGGIPLVSAASLASGIPCVFIRNKKKDYGTARQLEGVLDENDRVVIVEDVATTGGQVLEAAQTIAETGATVLAIICTIDRQEGARENIEAAGYRFDALFTVEDLGIEKDAP